MDRGGTFPEQLRRWTLLTAVLVCGFFVSTLAMIVVPLHHRNEPSLSLVAFAILCTNIFILFSLQFALRSGLDDREARRQRQPGEAWWRAVRRRAVAGPSHRPFNVLLVGLGACDLAVSLLIAASLRSFAAVFIGVVGIQLLAQGGAEFLPRNQRWPAFGLCMLNVVLACVNFGLLVAYSRR